MKSQPVVTDVALSKQTHTADKGDTKKALYFAFVSSINDLLLLPIFLITACALGTDLIAEVAECFDSDGDKQDCLCAGAYEYSYSDNECEDESFWTMGPLLFGSCVVWMYEGLYGIVIQLFLIVYHLLYGEKTIIESIVSGLTLNGERKDYAKWIFGIRIVELVGCIIVLATYSGLDCACTDSSDIFQLTQSGRNRQSSYVMFVISTILIIFFLLSRRILLCLIKNIKITTETNVLLFRLQYVDRENAEYDAVAQQEPDKESVKPKQSELCASNMKSVTSTTKQYTLPNNGWRKLYTPEGTVYYQNDISKVTQWDQPYEFRDN